LAINAGATANVTIDGVKGIEIPPNGVVNSVECEGGF